MAHAKLLQPVFHSHNVPHMLSRHIGVLHWLGDVDADGDEDAVYLSPLALGLAALLLIINGLLSVYLSLGLHRTLGIAAVRQVALTQLLCSFGVTMLSLPVPFTPTHMYLTLHVCRGAELSMLNAASMDALQGLLLLVPALLLACAQILLLTFSEQTRRHFAAKSE